MPPQAGQAVEIPRTQRHRVHSEQVGAEFEIWIAEAGRPARAAGDEPGPPQILYVLDANLFFGTAVEMTRIMTQLFGELPPVLVVGIAYPTDDPRILGELRNRDFTPSSDASFEEMGRRVQPDWEPLLPQGERMGGAGRFLNFLVEDVRPLVEESHEVAPGNATLFGASLGGLFTLYAFLARPDAFDNYVAASPSIWWDDEVLFDLEAELARGAKDVRARIFLGVGSLEEDDRIPFLARFKTVTNVRTMAERLEGRGYPTLSVRGEVIDGETHTTVVPVALTRGLRWVLGPSREP